MELTEYQGHAIDGVLPDAIRAFAKQAFDEMWPGVAQRRVAVIDYAPGNGTRYVLVFTPVPPSMEGAVGNEWVLSIPNMRVSYPIGLPSRADLHYCKEKWLNRDSDAAALSLFLNALADAMAGAEPLR
jgi:hypothetical protein